jgi:hypothetical protein
LIGAGSFSSAPPRTTGIRNTELESSVNPQTRMFAPRQAVAPTFLSAGAGDFPVASSCLRRTEQEIGRHGNTGLASPAHPPTRKPALPLLRQNPNQSCSNQVNRAKSSQIQPSDARRPAIGRFRDACYIICDTVLSLGHAYPTGFGSSVGRNLKIRAYSCQPAPKTFGVRVKIPLSRFAFIRVHLLAKVFGVRVKASSRSDFGLRSSDLESVFICVHPWLKPFCQKTNESHQIQPDRA